MGSPPPSASPPAGASPSPSPSPTPAAETFQPSPPFDPAAGFAPWQAGILAGAYLAGKRKVSVTAVCEAADLDRASVLAWFKAVDALPAGGAGSKESALQALVAAGAADAEVSGRATALAAARAAAGAAAAAAVGRPWSPPPADRRFSAAALATLERVFAQVRD